MRLTDRYAIHDFTLSAEGYLRVGAVLARTGIQEYAGYEIGADDAGRTYRVHRPAAEVFSDDAIASFDLKPVTDGHPIDGVTASNWRKETVGLVMPGVRRDGGHLAGVLLVTDADNINRVQRERTVELSCGYDCDVVWEAGVTEDGEPFDAYQANIRGNHVALVERGRCGPACAVSTDHPTTDCSGPICTCGCTRTDPLPPADEDHTMANKTVTIDGKSYEVPAEVADALATAHDDKDKATQTLDALVGRAEALRDSVANDRAEHDRVIAAKDAEIEDLKKRVPTADELDAALADRMALIEDARTLHADVEHKGKSAHELRVAALQHVMSDNGASLDGRSEAYVEALFDHRVAAAKDGADDPTIAALRTGTKAVDQSRGRDSYLKSMADAWKA